MSAGPSTVAACPIRTTAAVRPGEDVVAVPVVRAATARRARWAGDGADGARRRHAETRRAEMARGPRRLSARRLCRLHAPSAPSLRATSRRAVRPVSPRASAPSLCAPSTPCLRVPSPRAVSARRLRALNRWVDTRFLPNAGTVSPTIFFYFGTIYSPACEEDE